MSAPDVRRAVVTGGARGIGRALAERLTAAGVRVVLNDLDESETQEVADRIGAHAVPGDAASHDGATGLVQAAYEHLGEVDVWFGNAGVVRGAGVEAGDDEWQTSWQVNTMAHVRAARLLVPRWVERGSGRYVVTASAAGLLTALGTAPYSVTKHATIAFAEWLSATYRHRGIVVQAICPQGVRTDMLEQSVVQGVLDGALTPQEVAEAAWQALDGDRFLVLPQPEVGDYYARRATDTDRWLSGMNRLQQRLDQ